MEFQRSWNEKCFQKVISEERHWSWGCDSLCLSFQERKHTIWFTHSCRHTVKGPEGSSTVGVFVAVEALSTKKAGWLNIYRQDLPLHQWAGFGRQRLGPSSQHLDSYRSPQPTSTAWTHHAPQEPASPYPPATESSASISLRALSRCLFSQIVTKGRGRREQYLFTTWWHHL